MAPPGASRPMRRTPRNYAPFRPSGGTSRSSVRGGASAPSRGSFHDWMARFGARLASSFRALSRIAPSDPTGWIAGGKRFLRRLFDEVVRLFLLGHHGLRLRFALASHRRLLVLLTGKRRAEVVAVTSAISPWRKPHCH